MLSRVHTCALFGIESFIIDVESDVSAGLATFDIVGLGDTAVKESKERIKASIKSVGSRLYTEKIVVNLAPASLKSFTKLVKLSLSFTVKFSKSTFTPSKRIA